MRAVLQGISAGASVGGLLNSTVGLGEFLGFTVDGITLDGAYTVDATGDYAGGAFGMAMAGDASKITIDGITSVSARNNAGGFVGLGGPGSLATAGDGGLTINLLGLNNLINLSNVLSVIPGLQMTLTDCSVTGGGEDFTVEAKGATGSDLADYCGRWLHWPRQQHRHDQLPCQQPAGRDRADRNGRHARLKAALPAVLWASAATTTLADVLHYQ